jgi:SAM-dependent methyltransferase
LEIAPIELVRATARDLGYRYASVDLHSPRALVLSDLCHSPFRDGSFDVIVCFHVLEHIIDDGAAMAEMARTLSPGGMALVVVPRDAARGPTFEGASADPSDNERLYGQSDHVRIYGDDVTARLERAGLGVDEVEWSSIFSAQEIERYRLAGDDDRFWICQRS